MDDHYAVLGVSKSASQEEIARAYRALVAKYHPDRHADNELRELAAEKMRQINRAYGILSKPSSRAAYDAEAGLRNPTPRPAGTGPASRPGGPSTGTIVFLAALGLAIPLLMRFLKRPRLVGLVVAGILIVRFLPAIRRLFRGGGPRGR